MMSEASPPRESKIWPVLRVTGGNFLEFFDFFLYGFFARQIAETFFPADSEFASLMAALVVFGAGFIIRPFGAFVLGAYVDRVGRRKGLIFSLTLLAIGTFTITFSPGYSTIGIIAPILVVIGRLLQGLSAGGEHGAVAIYLSEMATPEHKGFYVAWQAASQQLATIGAGVSGYLVSTLMMPATVAAWGWRIPFLVGCLIIPFVIFLRRSLQETEAFKAEKHHPGAMEVMRTLVESWQAILGGMLIVITMTVAFYTITAYTPTFGARELHLTTGDSLLVAVCIGASNLFWLPLAGALSDRIGRKPVLLIFSSLMLVTAYPVLSWLVLAPTFQRMLIVELWLSFTYAGYSGAMMVALTEVVPARARVSGFSVAYNLATTLGGFSLAICTGLIQLTGNRAAPGFWMSFAAFCGIIGTLWLYSRQPATAAARSRALDPGLPLASKG